MFLMVINVMLLITIPVEQEVQQVGSLQHRVQTTEVPALAEEAAVVEEEPTRCSHRAASWKKLPVQDRPRRN